MVLVEAFKDPSHKNSMIHDENAYTNEMMNHCHVGQKGRALIYASLRYNGSRQWGFTGVLIYQTSMMYRKALLGCLCYICFPKLCIFGICSALYTQTLLLDNKV